MDPKIIRSMLKEITKIAAETAFSKKQYNLLFGPKRVRKNKDFINSKENIPASSFQSLTPGDATYGPVSSSNSVLTGTGTPGGP